MSRLKKRHRRLEVEWEDSVILTPGWHKINEALARRESAVVCTSIGVVLADDSLGLMIAASVHGNEAAGITVIPRSQVRKIRDLQRATKP